MKVFILPETYQLLPSRPIIQTAFRTLPPSYTLLHIDTFASAQEKSSSVDPVLHVDSGENSVCCHRSAGGLHILCPVRGDGE